MKPTDHTPSAKGTAWYALRRTLPPWSFERNLAELTEVLPRYRVNELIVKIDTEEFSHGQPPLAWVKRYQPRLLRIKEAMEKLGIRYSLNPWITVGHNDSGRDSRRRLTGLRTMVGHDGTECTSCACPLCPVWQRHVARIWTLYARTKPYVLWIEDDIRTFNHAPLRYGCFCPLHLEDFSRHLGQKVTREELVAALLRPGKPHPWRTLFLRLQSEWMTDTVAFLARVVHAVSPETCLGLMSSGPRRHILEGRRWHPFAAAMADGRPLYSRPSMGNYAETSLRGLYSSQDSIKLTRHCLPPGVLEQSELENVPFTQYSKSAVFSFLQMAVSFAYGTHGVTMNLFDHAGSPMEEDAVFGRLLAEKKPWLEALARRAQVPGTYRGVRLLHDEKAAMSKRLRPGATFEDLAGDGAEMMHGFEGHGIPTTYDASEVTAVSGQTLSACSDKELRALLRGNLLLDAEAASGLHARGFGKDLGLQTMAAPVPRDTLGALAAEEFHGRLFGGKARTFLSLRMKGNPGGPVLSPLHPVRQAHVISSVVDPNARRRFACMTAFENQSGSRVVVHGLSWRSASSPAFYHAHRRRQLQGAVQWLTRGTCPLLVCGGVHPLAFRKDTKSFTLLGLFNLSLDPWPTAEFLLYDQRKLQGVEWLTDRGQWRKTPALIVQQTGRQHTLRWTRPLPFDKPLLLTLHWA